MDGKSLCHTFWVIVFLIYQANWVVGTRLQTSPQIHTYIYIEREFLVPPRIL